MVAISPCDITENPADPVPHGHSRSDSAGDLDLIGQSAVLDSRVVRRGDLAKSHAGCLCPGRLGILLAHRLSIDDRPVPAAFSHHHTLRTSRSLQRRVRPALRSRSAATARWPVQSLPRRMIRTTPGASSTHAACPGARLQLDREACRRLLPYVPTRSRKDYETLDDVHALPKELDPGLP